MVFEERKDHTAIRARCYLNVGVVVERIRRTRKLVV